MEQHPPSVRYGRVTMATKTKKPARAAKPKTGHLAPCDKCKSFTVTPSRNRAGRFVSKKEKQLGFKF